jgi:hypothetical protein
MEISSFVLDSDFVDGGCKSDPQNAIIGVWRDTKESSNPDFLGTSVEFVDDGTLILTKTWKSSHEVYVGDYQMIDGNRIRVSMSSIPPIILDIDSLA